MSDDPRHTVRALLRRPRPVVVALLLALVACAPGVAPAAESGRIAEILELEPGDRVADVGAGDGRWAVALAAAVGTDGEVWATEVDADEIAKIERRVESEGLENVRVVLGDDLDTGLPAGCCDAILLRMVYHHFTRPEPMRASLRRALAPGGRLAVIDIVPQTDWRDLPGVPDRGGHGLTREALEAELTADGFEVFERYDAWNGDEERYCVVFRLAAAGGPGDG